MIEGKKVKGPLFPAGLLLSSRLFFSLRERRITRRDLFIRVDSILSPLGTLHRGMIHPLLIALVPFIRCRLFFNRLVGRTRRTLR